MEIAEDIITYVQKTFSEPERDEAISLMSMAVTHDGLPAGPRLQRCAVVAAHGSLEKLRYYIDLLKIDYRDVIVAGEYENVSGTLIRSRDCSSPIS